MQSYSVLNRLQRLLLALTARLLQVHAHLRDLPHLLLPLLLLLLLRPVNQSCGHHSLVHLAEEEPQDALAVLPLQVVQVDFFAILRFLLVALLASLLLPVLAHLLLNLGLLANLFLNLLQRLQEELLDLRPLVQNNLRERFHLLKFLVLRSKHFSSIQNLLPLFFDDRFMLKPDHFLLFFEIADNLLQRFLQNLDFLFRLLDFAVLLVLSADVFLLGALVDIYVSFQSRVLFF